MAMLENAPAVARLPGYPLSILMVTDSNGSYSGGERNHVGNPQRSFELLIDSLNRQLSGWVSLRVGKAHRDSPSWNSLAGTADEGLESFRFLRDSLDAYDELWLFGIASDGQASQHDTGLTTDEARVIGTFMNSRGGVFATGDHEDLGAPLCGIIPRVQHMRSWRGLGLPAATGPNRIDTRVDTGVLNRLRGETETDFDRQILNEYETDGTPQRIYPVWFSDPIDGSNRPHPLLCGPRGAIRYMPDHMHEGRCVDGPLDDGDFLGIAPIVIAYGINAAGMHAGERFPSISTYDGGSPIATGDGPDCGRIVVQSTFHHFVELNLQGFESGTEPQTHEYWDDMQAYFRNLCLWLAPPAKRRGLLEQAFWYTRWHYRVDEELARQTHPGQLEELAVIALDVLETDAPLCWSLDEISRLVFELNPSLRPYLTLVPWGTGKAKDRTEYSGLFKSLSIHEAVIAGVLRRIYKAFPSARQIDPAQIKVPEKWLSSLVREGAKDGLASIASSLHKSLAKLSKLQNALEAT